MASWKTTALGILTILIPLLAAAQAYLTGAGDTINWTIIGTAIAAGIGLILARDHSAPPTP